MPVSEAQRQILRVATARGWTAAALRLTNERQSGVERRVMRLAATPETMDRVKELAAPFGVSPYFVASAERFFDLREMGDTSVLNLRGH